MNKPRLIAKLVTIVIVSLAVHYAKADDVLKSKERTDHRLAKMEREYTLSNELSQIHIDQPEIKDYFQAVIKSSFNSKSGEKIAFRKYVNKNNEGALIYISSGRTESFAKYEELILDFGKQGYSVYIHDHRGQGESDRSYKTYNDDPQKGYIEYFEQYVEDLKRFYQLNSVEHTKKKKFLVAHSMGGAIAALYAQTFPADFDALVLVSPMLEPRLTAIGFDITYIACPFSSVFSLINPEGYAIGEKSYDTQDLSFKATQLTHSKNRFDQMRLLFEKSPDTKVGGATHRWLAQACSGAEKARENADKVSVPALIIEAGDDEIVRNVRLGQFCEKINKSVRQGNCKHVVIEKSNHAVFMEADTFRIPALVEILDFLKGQKK